MASKAFYIELRVSNVDDAQRLSEVRRALQSAGQLLFAQAMLICGEGPEPEIVLFGENLAEGRTEIMLDHEEAE
jgi:hypothetical protein